MRYQTENIKDRDVEVTPWEIGNDDDKEKSCFMKRTITFSHPIKTNSMGLGPSEARTRRIQSLWRFEGDRGIVLENKTFVDGIPASDSFHVFDRWLLEPQGETQLMLSASFEIRFTKRSLFRGIIEKSVKKETVDWWIGFITMLQEVLKGQEEKTVISVPDVIPLAVDDTPRLQHQLEIFTHSTMRMMMIIMFSLLVILIMLGVQILVLRSELGEVRATLSDIRRLQYQCTSTLDT